jgi:hypothetical protein
VKKSREAVLCAIQVFNNPLVTFKSESFIVLMIIAWTYLMHAYYRSKKVDYRYYIHGSKRKIYDTTKNGAKKHWELERCLNDQACPLDLATKANLRFLIGLRHEIEHQMATGLDDHLSARYQACAINFNFYIKKLFGSNDGLDDHLSFSLQFSEMAPTLPGETGTKAEKMAKPIRQFVSEFDRSLTDDERNDQRFAYRLIFTKKLVNRLGQADRVIEFIDPKSNAAKEINKEYWVRKEVEKPKFLPTQVAKAVKDAGYPKFRIQPEHVYFWKEEDAKNPAKGYGVEVSGSWYWYQTWIDRCIQHCKDSGEKYK